MSETPTGTDRVELTEDEFATVPHLSQLDSYADARDIKKAVERLLAARVQALTAERDELLLATQTTVELETVRWERDSALGDKERAESEWDDWKSAAESYEAERDAARAELAAANAELDRLAALKGRVDELAEYAERAQVAEARCAEHVRIDTAEKYRAKAEALQATLDRVTAVLGTPDGKREWHNQGRSGECDVVDVSRVRAALTPEGKP